MKNEDESKTTLRRRTVGAARRRSRFTTARGVGGACPGRTGCRGTSCGICTARRCLAVSSRARGSRGSRVEAKCAPRRGSFGWPSNPQPCGAGCTRSHTAGLARGRGSCGGRGPRSLLVSLRTGCAGWRIGTSELGGPRGEPARSGQPDPPGCFRRGGWDRASLRHACQSRGDRAARDAGAPGRAGCAGAARMRAPYLIAVSLLCWVGFASGVLAESLEDGPPSHSEGFEGPPPPAWRSRPPLPPEERQRRRDEWERLSPDEREQRLEERRQRGRSGVRAPAWASARSSPPHALRRARAHEVAIS